MATLFCKPYVIGKFASLLGACLIAWGPVASAKTQSITVTATNAVINFGSFAVLPSCANCSITISPSGARTATAGIVLTSANPGQAGSYSVVAQCNGQGCDPYSSAMTPTSATLTAGGVTMTVDTFTLQPSGSLPNFTMGVGARLTIPSNPGAGTYTGAAFMLTVDSPP
ncbi:DUF4402 domain-containing protein [Polaromonas sp.]|uniref:DUF4402 domain-containing protein n=1 Tax=Polaromonas sp. TaxID=1869339 RepID=UPI0032653697